MITLALEFSSALHSAAVARCAADTPPAVLGESQEEGGRHIRSLELVAGALAAAHVEREAVERIVVGLGPGSLTGIRAAIALAQGWQLARGVPVLGVSSVECLAAQAHALGWHGAVHVVLDAQRGEFFLAGFDISAAGWRATSALRLASADEVASLASSAALCIGPGAERLGPGGRNLFPHAARLAQLSCGRPASESAENLEPINLREMHFAKAPAPRLLPRGATGHTSQG